jgi:predicted lipoprotein with Yx(FWY)xxD motif
MLKEERMAGIGRTMSSRTVAVVALTGAAFLVAACGSSSSSSGSQASAAAITSPTSAAPGTPATGATVRTATGPIGTYLTGPSGRALYIWVADSKGKSRCNGACAAAWPPLITKAAPTASGGVISADLGMITRANGSRQVTYQGRPLYYYVGDTGPGTTTGNGSNGFGAKWWLISPSGGWVTPGG